MIPLIGPPPPVPRGGRGIRPNAKFGAQVDPLHLTPEPAAAARHERAGLKARWINSLRPLFLEVARPPQWWPSALSMAATRAKFPDHCHSAW